MSKKKKLLLVSLVSIVILVIMTIFLYFYNLNPVNKFNDKPINFEVKSGEAVSTVISNLKKNNLIKSELCTKIYIKFLGNKVQAGKYILKKNMSTNEIYKILSSGKVTFDTIWITFVEGKRIEYVAEKISKNFPYTKEEVMKIIDDKEFIKKMILKYDILTEDVLNEKIYHPLEGYLFPNTYEFTKDSKLEDIIEKMLSETDKRVSKYEKEIKENNLSIHEIMTLASIVEMEGTNKENRPKIAGVFLNRLNNPGYPTLGSDVTSYYGVNKDFNSDLTMSDLKNCNPYNTSQYGCVKGLPIGPISSIGMDSIEAAIKPESHDYYFFVSDKFKKIYFSKTNTEHINTINKLKKQGLWFEY